MDLNLMWQVITTLSVGVAVITAIRVEVASLKESLKQLREENKEIKKTQASHDIEIALIKGSAAHVRQYADTV